MAAIDQINQGGIIYELVPEIAELFSTTKAYHTGDHVIYEAGWYTFKADKSAGAWDATKVNGPFKVTKQLSDLKEELSDVITPTAEGWEQGGINSSDGVSLLTTTTRIRTIDYLPNNVGVIKAINGYTFALFAYDSFETYLGNYNNGAFVKSLNFVSEADIRDFDKGNKYKLVVRRSSTTQDIAPAECINIECISIYSDVNASEIDSVKKINGMNPFTTFDVESGGINLTNGEDVALTTRIRTGYIQANAGTYIKCDDGYKFAVAEYTSFGGGLYSFVDGSYGFVKEYIVKNNAYIRCSLSYNKERTIDVTSKEHLKIYVKNEPIWSDIYVRKIPRFEQGGLLNSDNTETPVNNQNYLIRVRTAPIYVKAGSWVEPLTGFSVLLREQKTNANGSEIYNLDNYISWTTDRVYVQHDCYLRIVGRKTNGSNVTPGEFGVRHYLLGKKEDPLLQFPLAEDSYNSVGSHEATIFFGKTANDVYSLWDAFADNSYCTKVNIGKDSSGLYDLASYNFVPAQVYSGSKPLNGSGLRKDNIMKVMLIAGLHGGEKPAVLALYNLMYNVINHWKENKILEFIRWNVELYVLPLLCPYAFDNLDVTNGRVNYNHVNINRNFACRYWDLGSSDSTSFDYRGSSPNSELETRTVVFLAKSITPDVLYDIHTYGNGSSYSKMFAWDNSGDGLPQGYMAEIGAEVIKATTLNGIINHGLPDNNLYISQINQDEKIAFVSQWATENGIYSATPELTYKLFGDTKTGDEAQTLDIREINEEFIANAIYYAAQAKYSGRAPMNKAE